MENLDLAIKAAMLRGEITNPGIVDKRKSKETWKLITLRNSSGRTLSRIPLTKVAELRDNGVEFTEEEIKQFSSVVESPPKRLSISTDKVLQRKNIFFKTIGAVSTVGIITFFANQNKIDTLTYKGKIYTASKACGFGKSMYWKTSAGLFGIGANAKEIGCMTRNDFKLREKRKKETRKGILLGIAEGLRGFSEGYRQGSNQGYYSPNAGQIRLRNQIQANKYQQDFRNLQQSQENHRQRMQQFNNQQTQMYKNFHQSTPYKPYGGYSSPYSGYTSPYSY